jgi:hypothetical protein
VIDVVERYRVALELILLVGEVGGEVVEGRPQGR